MASTGSLLLVGGLHFVDPEWAALASTTGLRLKVRQKERLLMHFNHADSVW